MRTEGGLIQVTPFQIAARFMGLRETPGVVSNPAVVAMLKLDSPWVDDDETAWCSAFVNYVAWLLECHRSKSLSARSWLNIGSPVTDFSKAWQGFHVVILSRGPGQQPGPHVLKAPGHVGFFAGWDASDVRLLGGNQGDAVSIAAFPKSRILGIREI